MITSLIKRKVKGDHLRELLSGGAIAVILKVFAAIVAFGLNIIVNRYYGATIAGNFFLALSILLVLREVAQLGMGNVIVRLVAHAELEKNMKQVYRIYWYCLVISIGVALVCAGLLHLFREEIWGGLFNKPEIIPYSLSICAAFVGIVILIMHSFFYQGQKRIFLYLTCQNTGWQVFFLVIVVGSVSGLYTASVYSVFLISTICAAILLMGRWLFSLNVSGNHKSTFDKKRFWLASLPLMGVTFLHILSQNAGQILLGVWGTSQEVAYFYSAERTAFLISFMLMALNGIAAPKFAELYKQNNIKEIEKICIWSTRILMLVSLPILLIILIMPEFIMGIFGDGFEEASTALVIMAIGHYLSVSMGAVGLLLVMAELEKYLTINTVLTSCLLFVIGVTLVPSHGLEGVAIAVSTTLVLQNLMNTWVIQRKLGFMPINIFKRF